MGKVYSNPGGLPKQTYMSQNIIKPTRRTYLYLGNLPLYLIEWFDMYASNLIWLSFS